MYALKRIKQLLINSKENFKSFFTSTIMKEHFSGIANIIAKRYSNERIVLNLAWDNKNEIAYTDNKEIYINFNNHLFKNLKLDGLYYAGLGLLGHETGHIIFTNFNIIDDFANSYNNEDWYNFKKFKRKKEIKAFREDIKNPIYRHFFFDFISMFSNLVEDYYIDHKIPELYEGTFKEGISYLRKVQFSQMCFTKMNIPYVDINNYLLFSLYTNKKDEEMDNKYPELKSVFKLIKEKNDDNRVRFAYSIEIVGLLWKYFKEYLKDNASNYNQNPMCIQISKVGQGEGMKAQSGAPDNSSNSNDSNLQSNNSSNTGNNSNDKSSCGISNQKSDKENNNDKSNDISKGEGQKKDDEKSSLQSKNNQSDKKQSSDSKNTNASSDKKSNEEQSNKKTDDDSLKNSSSENKSDDKSSNKSTNNSSDDNKNGVSNNSNNDSDNNNYRDESEANKTLDELISVYISYSAKNSSESINKMVDVEIIEDAIGDSCHKNYPYIINNMSMYPKTTYSTLMKPILPISKRLQRKFVDLFDDMDGGSVKNLLKGNKINPAASANCKGRVFKRNIFPEEQDVAISFLIDQSGSMSGERLNKAREMAVLVTEFCQSLEIPLNIVGHCDSNGKVNINKYISFGDNYSSKFTIPTMSAYGCNRDGLALRYCVNKLKYRDEQNKLMIILSDGKPNSHNYNGVTAYNDLKQIKNECKKNNIVLIAAAIGDDKEIIKKIYGDSFLDISDLNTLPVRMIKLISKFI